MEAHGAGSSGTRVVFSVSDTTTGFPHPQQKSMAAAEVERDEIVWHYDEETVGEGVGAGGLLDLSEAEDGDIDVEGIANRLGLPTSFQSGKEATAKRKKERRKKAGKVRSAPEKSQVFSRLANLGNYVFGQRVRAAKMSLSLGESIDTSRAEMAHLEGVSGWEYEAVGIDEEGKEVVEIQGPFPLMCMIDWVSEGYFVGDNMCNRFRLVYGDGERRGQWAVPGALSDATSFFLGMHGVKDCGSAASGATASSEVGLEALERALEEEEEDQDEEGGMEGGVGKGVGHVGAAQGATRKRIKFNEEGEVCEVVHEHVAEQHDADDCEGHFEDDFEFEFDVEHDEWVPRGGKGGGGHMDAASRYQNLFDCDDNGGKLSRVYRKLHHGSGSGDGGNTGDGSHDACGQANAMQDTCNSHGVDGGASGSGQAVCVGAALEEKEKPDEASGSEGMMRAHATLELGRAPSGGGHVMSAPEPGLKKYWINRHLLFSKFDQGIELDRESWYSVTPEALARHHALRVAAAAGGRDWTVIDAFCGAGGNAIQLAQTCTRVIAIDIDPEKVRMAKHNAGIYGVADRIQFIVGDVFEAIPTLKADACFMSPPWGGPEYQNYTVLDMRSMSVDGATCLQVALGVTPNVACFLPKNVNVAQLVACGDGQRLEVEKNILNGRLKAVTAYYGSCWQFTTSKH